MLAAVHVAATPTWSASAAAGTAVEVDVPKRGALLDPHARHRVTIRNPSDVTALTVEVFARHAVAGGALYLPVVLLDAGPLTFTVPAGETRTFEVGSWIRGGARLRFTNDVPLADGDGFRADVVVR